MNELGLGLVVFGGAGIGGALRHAANRLIPLVIPGSFPVSTLIVNAIGCFVMGGIAAFFALRAGQTSQELRLFLMTGILGGFTTFSAFSLEFAVMVERGEVVSAVGYVAATLAATLIGVFAGMFAVRILLA